MFRPMLAVIMWVAVLCSCGVQPPPADHQAVSAEPAPAEDEIDEALRRAADEALEGREGAAVVIDPNTGRLRAVVNPRVTFGHAYPPGSAIKPFTALAAMRAGLLDRETRHLCRTRYTDAGFQILCSHPRSNSPFDLAQALAYSCNDYFGRVGERLSEGSFDAVLGSFGFGSRTGISADETAGRLPHGEWHVRYALGEGEHLLVTPIQLITAYAALVNGGHLYRPSYGRDRVAIRQEVARLKIQPQQRAVLIEGMRGAVRYGTAEKARLGELPFYVFGKTGTSTSSNGFHTQGWFVGFVAEKGATGLPRDDQIKLGVLVFLKRSHGSQCAEVARKIFEGGFRRRGEGSLPVEGTGTGRVPASSLPAFPGSRMIKVRSVSENLVRELPFEEYLVGVLAGESSIESETEALKAQAVISRTFALKNLGRHAPEGFDFCSTTHCQRYVFAGTGSGPPRARRAVEATRSEVLRDGRGEVVDAYFHAACGGVTAKIESLWGGPSKSYLQGVRDDFCAAMPHRHWTQTIPSSRLAGALQHDERTDVGPQLHSIIVSKRDSTGRAESLRLEGARRQVVRGWDFKIVVGRNLGWQMIKSSRFDVSRSGSNFVFRGSGFGHGLGLCQAGSHVMASRGMNYRQIINHYFPGTRFESSSASSIGYAERESSIFTPISWLPESSVSVAAINYRTLSSEHFRASFAPQVEPVSVGNALRELESARLDLLRRLQQASLQLPEPKPFEVMIHGTTAGFIAATGQPGWVAGVTRGRRIELQPLKQLSMRRILMTALRHELTHAVIEVLSKGRAPRWLAEGLAIHVAGEGAGIRHIASNRRLSGDELERRLQRPVSAKEMRELYEMAYLRVRALIETKGESDVWQLVVKPEETLRLRG